MTPERAAAEPLLTVSGAIHAYGVRGVLKGVDLALRPGEIYALLGPNGAGKTTLIRAISGRLKLDGGTVTLNGGDPWRQPKVRGELGLVPQELAIYPHLTVRENLEVFASLWNVPRGKIRHAVDHTMVLTRTADRANMQVKTLSGGYQRRVNIGVAILHEPKLLILDEPTVGVDIDAREALDAVIRLLRDSGVAVLMTTHDLEQAGALADRVGFLRDGRMVLEGQPHELIAEAFGAQMEILVQLSEEPDSGGEIRMGAEGLERRKGTNVWTKLDTDGYAAAGRLDQRLRKAGLHPREIRVREPSLANLFTLVAERRHAA